ncbi:hypothetical protein GTY41_06795, partial [Streptomyces sp. SID685]|uniref:hypothetical protein n=1 Tax=Streptomyces sp. SID685 TaxID=2690322 RepID=UPI0014071500
MTRGAVGRRAALLSAGLVLAAVPAPGAVAAQGVAPVVKAAPGKRTGPAPKTVTLVTGDKVTVTDLGHGKETATVERPPGATGAVRTQT